MVRVDENGNAPLNIRIPEAWFAEKEEIGANWREIVGLGLRAKKDNPQLLDRIRQLETHVEYLRKREVETTAKIDLLTRILKDQLKL